MEWKCASNVLKSREITLRLYLWTNVSWTKVFETLNVLINLKVRENALLMSLCVETDWKLSRKVCICDCSKLELLYFVSLLKNCIWRGSLILKLRFFCKFVVVCKRVRMDVVTVGLLSFVLTNNVYNWQRTCEDALKACVAYYCLKGYSRS